LPWPLNQYNTLLILMQVEIFEDPNLGGGFNKPTLTAPCSLLVAVFGSFVFISLFIY
jgi:hypothetical protein